MHLTPREQERLLIHVAADVARKRRARGLALNYPEAIAILTADILEWARDGKSVAEIMTPSPQGCSPFSTVAEAALLLRDDGDAIPVVEAGKPVGLLTEREIAVALPDHPDLASLRQDPRFYTHLAAWYFDKGEVRDHKEMFAITLALSSFPGHRDVGLALLRELPPYQVVRVLDFINGRREVPRKDGEKVQVYGLFRNPPRALRTEAAAAMSY